MIPSTQQVPMGQQDPKQALLAQLYDVKSPEAIGWWPPAPGWWVLAAILLFAIIACVYVIWQRQKRQRYRKEGLKRLEMIVNNNDAGLENQSRDVVQLSKQIFFSAYPALRSRVSGIYGPAWIELLVRSMKKNSLSPEFSENMNDLLYKKTKQENAGDAFNQLVTFVRGWIKLHHTESKVSNNILNYLNQTAEAHRA